MQIRPGNRKNWSTFVLRLHLSQYLLVWNHIWIQIFHWKRNFSPFLHENDQIITYSSSIAHGRLKNEVCGRFYPYWPSFSSFQWLNMHRFSYSGWWILVLACYMRGGGGYSALQNIQTGSIHHGIHSKGLIAIYHDRLYSQNQQKIMRHLIFHVFGSRLAKSSKSLYVQFWSF